ncbi:26S protease regulatory subunit [Microlunatus elymi]|uniref:26S protease regulatory subunit n=2 Tax=Microlunatus elymi TaxID=2596828 RepID=A0A516Q683_9ACTN|nr:26S protease regulatory subunit [Microlunatus elymi]
MDAEQRDFVVVFKEFLDKVNREWPDSEQITPLGRALSDHLGSDARKVSSVTEPIANHRLVDADVALATLAADGRLIGCTGGMQRHHQSLQELVSNPFFGFDVGPASYVEIAAGPDRQRRVVAYGIWLFRFDDTPVAVLQRNANPQFGQEEAVLELMSPEVEVTGALLTAIRQKMRELSVLRGQVISFAEARFGDQAAGTHFISRPEVSAAEVILPSGVLDRIVDHVVGIGDHRVALARAGQHLKRGILLYGPPGTGKTHTVRHLIGRATDATVVLLTGPAIARIGDATELARALQPAVVVLEDVDLIAHDRDSYGPQPLLFTVLDALDGLDGDADVAFVMTTNRVELLERALAERPGRVDLAVEVPLPADSERRQLFRLYGAGLDLDSGELDAAADRAAGTTASFAKELMRRVVLRAIEQNRGVTAADLHGCLDELLSDREVLTRALLGVGQPGVGPSELGGSVSPPTTGDAAEN